MANKLHKREEIGAAAIGQSAGAAIDPGFHGPRIDFQPAKPHDVRTVRPPSRGAG